MKRIQEENYNTKDFYNQVLVAHFLESGVKDEKDIVRLRKLLNCFCSGKLVDIACGISYLPFIVSELLFCEKVFAVDFADKFIDLMKLVAPRSLFGQKIEYVVGETTQLPFEDLYFEYAVLGEILDHSEDPPAVLFEAHRVLKKNGIVAISVPNIMSGDHAEEKNHLWHISREDLIDLIQKDFELLRLEVYLGTLYGYGIKV